MTKRVVRSDRQRPWARAGRCCVVLWAVLLAAPALADDAYIAGYAAAVLEREFHLTDSTVHVKDGVVTIAVDRLGPIAPEQIERALAGIAGVTRVEVREGRDVMEGFKEAPAGVTVSVRPGVHLFPPGLLFEPMHADPRWPRFNAGFRRITSRNDFKNVFYGNFGETFAIYRNAARGHGQWEIGIQAGAFTIFDQSSQDKSKDLVNADYRVGMMTSYRSGAFSTSVRVSHLSSHLGDEYVLAHPGVQRLNLSYEELDWKLSYDLVPWLRAYGGAGVIVRPDPSNLGRGSAQYGVEFVSPTTFLHGQVRPVTFIDAQTLQRTGWSTGVSVLSGLQLESIQIGGRKGMFLFEYFDGPAPDGQFFVQKFQWFGAGIHLYF